MLNMSDSNCDHEKLQELLGFGNGNEEFTCPDCQKKFTVEYDLDYDGEDVSYYFWLEEIKEPPIERAQEQQEN